MEQVLLNVCTNAVEAVRDGGFLTVATTADPEFACITVEDDGPGISPEVLPRIFEPFFTTKDHGAGLGLSIAYEIIRAHDGRIEFSSRNGQGTVCRILLPFHPRTAREIG
jgi:signal transduction histidine kinase